MWWNMAISAFLDKVFGTDKDYSYMGFLKDFQRAIQDENFIKTADLSQIKTMLTFCVRGERFCDGHWADMIESDHIRRLFERLAEINKL